MLPDVEKGNNLV